MRIGQVASIFYDVDVIRLLNYQNPIFQWTFACLRYKERKMCAFLEAKPVLPR
jgi:hypothetical protein